MNDLDKTKEQLIEELQELRSQVAASQELQAISLPLEHQTHEPTFAELIDIHQLQTLLELHVNVTKLSVGILDRDLNRLVSAGSQEICMRFHRTHPLLNERCRQSDDIISSHVNDGQHIEYRCKNGLWDVAVPILIAEKHMATLFIGQFFYQDDPPDIQFFQQQAREYGLPEQEYLAALRQVPIFSREIVQHVINYYTNFVKLLSIMGYSHLHLACDIKKRQEIEKALRESDERYRSLFERSLDILYLHDFEGNFLDVNQAALDLLGYSREDIPSLNFASLLEPAQIPLAMKSMRKLQRLGENKEAIEFTLRRKDGRQIQVETRASLILQHGKPYAVQGIARDITERKRVEQQVWQSNEALELRVRQRTAELEAANTALKDFGYVISHDLKAPLSGISRLAHWLVTDYADSFDEYGQEMLALLINRVNRMNDLIEGIFEYSRIGRDSDKKQRIDVKCLIQQVLDMIVVPEHIHVTIQDELPTIVGNITRIQEIFQNLLSNAIAFQDKKHGEIRISAETHDSFWIFRVFDNGRGIEPRHQAKIFQMFQTLQARDEYESTGIGLALAKKIVEFYGGTIWVESEPGEGSTFFFTLPKEGNAKILS